MGGQLPDGAFHVIETELPEMVIARPLGAPGAVAQGTNRAPTMTLISFDGPLTPAPFFARTRTKYVPAGTPSAISARSALPVSKFARSVNVVAEPASTTYEDGASPATGACHVRLTVAPTTMPMSPDGVVGATSAPLAALICSARDRTGSQSFDGNGVTAMHCQVTTAATPTPLGPVSNGVKEAGPPARAGRPVVAARSDERNGDGGDRRQCRATRNRH